MADQIFPESGLPIRRTVDLLPQVFKTDANEKFMAAVVDPLVQPGVLEKTVGYVGRRHGKTFKGSDVYLDDDETLRSRYQLEPGVVLRNENKVENFYDYIDFKNQLKFFNNISERDDLVTSQDHYSWNPPIEWDKFVNFREYYWVPAGPPSVKVLGQGDKIVSTYKVRQGTTQTWIFYPDGQTNNPTLTLYRGQTYQFNVNSPREGFTIRTAFDTGSLAYRSELSYVPNQLAIYDGKLYRALDYITPSVDGVIVEGPQWELVDEDARTSKYDYMNGVTNNGTTNGVVTFEVPLDAPDVLFYQSATNPDRYGRFIIADIEENTKINVEKEIVGKETYTSSNGIEFTNGLIVRFGGKVTPAKYAKDLWLVERVGREITLIKFADLEVPIVTTKIPEVIFDNGGFDVEPFDDATAYPGEKDYLTICRSSIDGNPWSRYNRWFHRSTLETAHRLNGTDFEAGDAFRAKRPIIEFRSNLQLFNHGSVAKTPVDFIDTFTTDVFSTIEGSTGYNVDGEFLFQGARILVTADTDVLANNKIYQVNFITHNNVKQIALKSIPDSESLLGECVLVKRGNINKGLMYHFDGVNWVQSQKKTKVNQSPLFDIFDDNGISFGDTETYPVSSFQGSKIVSYQVGNSIADTELGFSLKYLNIDNVGDVLFRFDLDTDSFTYSLEQKTLTKKLSTGFFRFNPLDDFQNGWIKTDSQYLQPIIDSQVVKEVTNTLVFDTIYWDQVTAENTKNIIFYRNGIIHTDSYTQDRNTFVFENSFAVNDTVSIKIYTEVEPDGGYYAIPLGLEKNPLNQELSAFTLGQAVDHISTSLEVDSRFKGSYPGNSNLRDLDGYQFRGMRFLKHSGIAPLAITMLCDKNTNIVKSLEYCKKQYTDFKNEFVTVAENLVYQDNIVEFVDEIISTIGSAKNQNDPFADSDMIGSGANTTIRYTVEDEGIKVFALSEKFDLTYLSRKAVYVYLNGRQLINVKDYVFDSTFGFVRLLTSLVAGDVIEIREYVSTAFNYIPATPTKLGLYKKYLPRKFLDDTYIEPREVIQGHDGSITAAYGDYRDDAILELELRIYNNIKQEYNENIFNIDSIVGGYYGNALYGKTELDSIVNQEFLKWVANTDIDFTDNAPYFDRQNSFTYTYSNMTDPTGSKNLPGYWRGVYQWFYDTDRPHTNPWEMLGFSEKPTWWEAEYGPAPYTSNNLILWEDLRDGIIRQGTRAGVYLRYQRPSIMSHLPVDGDGKLLSPLDSGLATNFTLVNNAGNFVVGDVSPSEYAWRSSSEWPFAMVIAMCLMKPFEFITDSFDRSRLTLNKLGQTVWKSTGLFTNLSNFVIPEVGGEQASGLITFVSSYVKSKNLDVSSLLERINSLDVQISTRLSGFVDQTEQKYLLDSKNPSSSSSSIFVPPENYDIIFNISVPMASIAYSGVLVEKKANGWKVRGYDTHNPYFNYFKPVPSSVDPVMTVGGTSEKFANWTAGKTYGNGDLVKYNDKYYRSLKTHVAGDVFDETLWKFLPKLPVTGGVEAAFRRTFNKLRPVKMVYGTILPAIQDVVDFLLGYEQYLKSQGLSFERYDSSTQTAYNWQTSCKEFLFWTKHNWSVGSLLSLSPSASAVEISIPSGVADNLFDPFYDYEIFKSDGTPLAPAFLNVKRDFQKVSISTVNTNEGIYFVRIHFVLKEHITLFSDKTVFNDVIYDKTTGYRQERIKSRGFRTVDWDGDYTSPGFLFDNVSIAQWQPFTDYRLGDIVGYRSYNWTSLENQVGTETFDATKWTKLDTTPTKGLVANFDYRINQFEDYYDVDADGLGSSQRDLSRHVLGYQTREYLQNLAEDNVSQFKLYQGFIREKGTANAITKVFNKLSRTNESSVVLNEEWAFRVGRLGGTDQFVESEFRVLKNEFQINPQPILLAPTPTNTDKLDLYMRVPQANFTISKLPFSADINPVRDYNITPRVAGYVNLLDVDFVVKTRDDILNLDIAEFGENSHVWVTFEGDDWTVLRLNSVSVLSVFAVSVNRTTVQIIFNRAHGLKVGDIFGIRNLENFEGFIKVATVPESDTITFEYPTNLPAPGYDGSTVIHPEFFTEARFENYRSADSWKSNKIYNPGDMVSNGDFYYICNITHRSTDTFNPTLWRYIPRTPVDLEQIALLSNGAKLWIDNNETGHWEVVEKQTQFTGSTISEYGTTDPRGNGSAVVYVDALMQVISSMPGSNLVVSYVERSEGLRPFQIIEAPGANSITSSNMQIATRNVFGETLAVSPDGKWLAVGSPNASGVKSNYLGLYNIATSYSLGDIVLYAGKLWRAKTTVVGTTDVSVSDNWEPVQIVTQSEDGTNPGYAKQGAVTMYEWSGQNWIERYSFISPRQHANEKFGSKISIGVSGSDYFMAVSAPGSLGNTGRVYLYKYAPATDDIREEITYNVTVGIPLYGDSGVKYYIDDQYGPQTNIVFLVGNTYVFDQTHYTNIFGPYNNPEGSVIAPQPLSFSSDNLSGPLGGGSVYSTNVTYYLDNRPVTQAQYISGFSLATTRRVKITVEPTTASPLYYYSTNTPQMGRAISKKYPSVAREWKHLESQEFKGTYDPTGYYPAGSIVWQAGDENIDLGNSFFQSLLDQDADGSSLNLESNYWKQIDPINTSSSLPATVAITPIDDTFDDSTLVMGPAENSRDSELVKQQDMFGSSLAMSRDGSVLVVGAPNSDGQYYENYRGVYVAGIEYRENEVVKFENKYYKLTPDAADSTYVSTETPPNSPWQEVGTVSSEAIGKIFIYRRNANEVYKLEQTITADNLYSISDLPDSIMSGDEFGYAIDIDSAGTTIVVSSPRADFTEDDQGSVYIFKYDTDSTITQFRLKQKLQNFDTYANEMFGFNVSVSPVPDRIVVSAKNTPITASASFNATTFDGDVTLLSGSAGYTGQVYVYELKDGTYFLAEKLNADLAVNESFGYALDATSSVVVTGSPDYKVGTATTKYGMTRIFRKDPTVSSWQVLRSEEPLVNIDLLKSIAVYDEENNVKLADLDIVDNAKFKILGIAEQELKYKTPFDPATYTNGDDTVSVDADNAWFEKNVGVLWWNTNTVKWMYYEQGDIAYRVGNWNSQAVGSTIEVSEWVESSYSPADWARLSNTAEGISLNVSGQPLYGTNVYSVKRFINPNTGLAFNTKYYFWVKGKTTVPQDVPGRRISAASVTSLIENPSAGGLPFLAIIDKDKFLAYNLNSIITGDSALINIEYYKTDAVPNNVHTEYQLLTEGVADSLPTSTLEQKWIDSLVGFNSAGNPVPDPTLTPKQRYGIAFRPIQTMFVNRATALKITIDNINSILKTRPFADLIDFENLNKVDPIPSEALNLYDVRVDTLVDLSQVGTVRIKKAVLRANIVDGEIDTIDIIDPGFGYKQAPPVQITGDGTGAKATVEIDNQGRVKKVNVLLRGRKYTAATLSVRSFSVLVETDSSFGNLWAIYSWDNDRGDFFKSSVQAYDTTKYWSLVDWYASGYTSSTRITKEIQNLYLEPTISVELGDIIRVKEFANGGWALLERVEQGQGDLLESYKLVARQNGTIKIDETLYDLKVYDTEATYDQEVYDNQPTRELRFILKAVKEDIFVDDLRVEWNKLFFANMRYIFSEQLYVDWAFKTSFLNAIHNVGTLEQRTSFRKDNLESFQKYLEEVKPYRTTIREYTSRYSKVDPVGASTTDFDLPNVYDSREGKIISVNESNEIINQYPWKHWLDNKGYAISSIELSNPGADYVTAPRVVITGDGSGATAQAYISNGAVSGVTVITGGTGYTYATVALVGGNGSSQSIAKAVPILGDSKIRSFHLALKFDRVTKEGSLSKFSYDETFTADGFTSVFNLSYPPIRDKTKISVIINNQIILDSDYTITFYKSSSDAYSLLRGKLILSYLPAAGDVIEVTYDKSDAVLDAVDRINKYYSPKNGMIGKEINQLMTGIDFGGVQIQGTTFDVSGGWDALPWFADTWDSVESSADFHYVIDSREWSATGLDSTDQNVEILTWKKGSVVSYFGKQYRAIVDNRNLNPEDNPDVWEELEIVLPYTPAPGQLVSIYLKRFGSEEVRTIDNLRYSTGVPEPVTTRIDDPNFGTPQQTNVHAVMPSFVGDGSSRSIAVQPYVTINDGDTLIFRLDSSDGTVTITDVNIIDTKLSGGTLSNIDQIYQTATGTLAEDITVDGSKFISPDQVPAPEENIPGQVLDSVSIKVFHTVQTGATPLQTRIVRGNGTTKRYAIGLSVLEAASVTVYVDRIKQGSSTLDSSIDYEIDHLTNEVVFFTAPEENALIEIISIGLGGAAILDYQEFVADGDTRLFLTRANYSDTASVVVTVDGIEADVVFVNSTDIIDTTNKTMIEFAVKPQRRQVVKIVCLGAATDVDSSGQSLVRVNQQEIVYDGSTVSYDLDKFVNLSRASAAGAMIVEINGKQLKNVDTSFVVYDGTNNVIVIETDPLETFNTATSEDIKVYINGDLKRYIIDYLYNGNENKITVDQSLLSVGDEIKIEVDLRSHYYVDNANLVLTNHVFEDTNINLQLGDVILVTWFSEYPSMNIISDQFTGGKVQYQLARAPISASYIWVYRNGERLVQDVDYEVSLPRSVVYMKNVGTIADEVKIVQFGNYVKRDPIAYEVFKDMLNIYHFKRYSISKDVVLTSDLFYYDQEILVSSTEGLFEPIREKNIPGVVIINNERIEYFVKTPTSLRQLRRGSLGTAIKETHAQGSAVVDVSKTESLPYNENQDRIDFVSDGSSLMIGPLEFIPQAANHANWTRTTIPGTYAPCDQLEVFVAGRRLRKDPVAQYNADLGVTSPEADVIAEAEFSVDGLTPYIRLTTAAPAGTRITIIRRTGKVWYDQGTNTASEGVTLVNNESHVLKFLTQKSTELPE